MSAVRFSTVLIIAALTAVTALTFGEVYATSSILPPEVRSPAHAASVDRSYDPVENLRIDRSGKPVSKGNAACLSARDRISLSSVYIQGAHAWFPRTAQGVTGVDGGLIELLSARNACQASIRSLA